MSTSTPETLTRHILCFYVPKESTSSVMSTVCKSGAGTFPGGLYTEAYWITSGVGQFRSNEGANPAIGKVGEIQNVQEDKVEVLCLGKECVQKALEELLKVHPYETVPYHVVRSEEF